MPSSIINHFDEHFRRGVVLTLPLMVERSLIQDYPQLLSVVNLGKSKFGCTQYVIANSSVVFFEFAVVSNVLQIMSPGVDAGRIEDGYCFLSFEHRLSRSVIENSETQILSDVVISILLQLNNAIFGIEDKVPKCRSVPHKVSAVRVV